MDRPVKDILGLVMSQRGISSVLAAIIVIIVVSLAFSYAPLSPSLAVTFKISHPKEFQYALEVTSQSYMRSSLSSVVGVTKGEIALIYAGGTYGSYVLSVTITYKGEKLSDRAFGSVGDGTYRIQVVYWPRVEDASIPYIVTFVLLYGMSQVATSTVTIYPR